VRCTRFSTSAIRSVGRTVKDIGKYNDGPANSGAAQACHRLWLGRRVRCSSDLPGDWLVGGSEDHFKFVIRLLSAAAALAVSGRRGFPARVAADRACQRLDAATPRGVCSWLDSRPSRLRVGPSPVFFGSQTRVRPLKHAAGAFFGDHRLGVTPVPIPNTVVKPKSPMILHRGKVGRRRSNDPAQVNLGGVFFCRHVSC
jgi:hypothetical protein